MWFAIRENETYVDFYNLMQEVGTAYMITLTSLSLWAIKQIQKYSQRLESLGIFANKRLFKIYAFFWIGASMCVVAEAVIYNIRLRIGVDEKSLANIRATIACTFFRFITVFMNLCLNLAILLTYFKFSNQLEQSVAQ